MGNSDVYEEKTTKPQAKGKVKLLVCKCKDCTHWEIGEDFILCKTCGLELPAKVVVDDHDGFHWQEHER
jgi:hypothetical protein